MTTKPVVLPAPSKEYDPSREATRNANIKAAIDRKLDSNNPAVYGGLPLISLKGSNSSLIAPNGAGYTLLPFNIISRETDPDLTANLVNGTVMPAYDMDVDFNVRVKYNSSVSGGASVDFYVGIFENGVEVDTYAVIKKLAQGFDPAFAFGIALTINKAYDLRLRHSNGAGVAFDMTKSSWRTTRVTPNPQVALGL